MLIEIDTLKYVKMLADKLDQSIAKCLFSTLINIEIRNAYTTFEVNDMLNSSVKKH